MEINQEHETAEMTTEEVTTQQETGQAIAEAATETPATVGNTAQNIPTANIKASKRFGDKYNRDLMAALLKEDSYTIDEAEKILNDFMGVK